MSRLNLLVLGLAVLVLSACQEQPATTAGGVSGGGNSQYMVFLENEDGVDPYQTRVIVTSKYMRFDDGEGSNDYVVFDRSARIIHSVNAQTRTVMLVKEKQLDLQPPFELVYNVRDMGEMKDAPTIKDQVPHHYQYLTNDKICVEVVSLPELMPDATVALREFHQVLASDSASTFANIPADMHVPCDISMSTFAPTQHLQNGFPIREWKPGYSRMLVDFKENYQADPKLFTVPKDYFTYTVQEMREGKVDFANRQMLQQ